MPVCPPENLLYACLTHVPLQVEFPSYVTPIYMGEAQGAGRLNLRDLAPEWEPYHPVLGATAGAFALKNLLLSQPGSIRQVGICQYRKFLSRERIGAQAQNYQVMDVLSAEQMGEFALADLMLPSESDFLIGKPGQFTLNGQNHGYLYQYKDVHHVEDFLRFTAVAVELGVLSKQEVIPFFDEKVFFPGGIELGVLPAEFWVSHITAIESVVRRCVQLHDTRRPDLQGRVWAFCAERLGSYFLLRHLRAQAASGPDWLTRHTGQLNLLVPAGEQHYVPGV
ncbi:hypothetical protein LRS11_03030 [Pseudomonas sp. J452]|uniref:hypothetical protein n=1 Tax=Pseudomonas sp. J452 TaxID=2898441 RepID=UPI0021ADBA65|nr:hypothetical protein [Pseudomonas sp. J452]UUY09023.1 hypothetical protein LRS11_03030 [Pseudomonas sp. J452]